MSQPTSPASLLVPGRSITGASAILLPFQTDDAVDWSGFDQHLLRTYHAGLIPAVNMDTGYGNLIDDSTRREVLKRANRLGDGKPFIAGVFVSDSPGDSFDAGGYLRGIDQIQAEGGTPIFFQSFGLVDQDDDQIVESYRRLGQNCDQFLFFELGQVFAPFGKIYSLDVYQELMQLPSAIGAKHSSLRRQPEWDRLALRNRVRPEFRVFTGNDLAIDMVMYGSDYLLGLSTFAPDAFAIRDRMWETGDPAFYELNDLLQYLGAFTFRDPTPAYKHSAAMFLKIRGMIQEDRTHPRSPLRPDSDRETLEKIADDLEQLIKGDS